MNDHEAFLAAIRANPGDEAPRLVYADWLEERGDPRGEYLRLEHQLNQVRRRLAALQAEIDPHWLSVITGCARVVLHRYPPNRKIDVIRTIRAVTGCGLKEVKERAEALPHTVVNGVSWEDASRIVGLFTAAGAEVSIEAALPRQYY